MLGSRSTNEVLDCYVRPFGVSVEDLDIDFDEVVHEPVSQLLQCCLSKDVDENYTSGDVLQWSLARRLQGLITVVIATRGDELLLDVNCRHKNCGENIELQLNLSQFYQPKINNVIYCRVDSSTELRLRLPNGYDQLQWSQKIKKDDCEMHMAAALIEAVNGKRPDKYFKIDHKWLEIIDNTLEQNDSLMTLELESKCPQCNRDFYIPLDLERQLINILRTEQNKLFRNIHTIAESYHWNESDIMALSPKRRQYYLELLNGDDDWI